MATHRIHECHQRFRPCLPQPPKASLRSKQGSSTSVGTAARGVKPAGDVDGFRDHGAIFLACQGKKTNNKTLLRCRGGRFGSKKPSTFSRGFPASNLKLPCSTNRNRSVTDGGAGKSQTKGIPLRGNSLVVPTSFNQAIWRKIRWSLDYETPNLSRQVFSTKSGTWKPPTTPLVA